MARVYLTICLLFAEQAFAQLSSQTGRPAVLHGGAGVAGPANADSMGLNPAQAGDAERTEVGARWGFSSYEYIQRYPGFDAHTSNKAGLSPGFPYPSVLYKFSRKLGLGGMIIPLSVKQDINVKRLPIVILGQQNYVDVVGSGQLDGMADLNLGYFFSPTVSAGMNLTYMAIKGTGALYPSGSTGNPLASFTISSTTIGVGFGMKLSLQQVTIGLSTKIFEQQSGNTKFDSSIAPKTEGASEGSGGSSSVQIFNPIRLGIEGRLSRTISLLLDFEYKRADKNQRRFSVVDFAEKDVDSYDTLSFYSSGRYQQNARLGYLLGFLYEPGSVGPGSAGKDGKSGFGFIDLAMAMGSPPAAPIWAAGMGAKYEFDRIVMRRKQDGPPQYRMAVESGLVYSETSIGVGEDGEQPGAYLVTRYTIPVNFSYRF